MKRYLSILVICGLMVPTILFPYSATKKGIVIEAIDYARTPNAFCIEAPVAEYIQDRVGKGIPASIFLNGNTRPVGITITNTTDKPLMLAPAYGIKTNPILVRYLANTMAPASFALWILAAMMTGYGAFLSSVMVGIVDSYDRPIAASFATALIAAFAGSTYMAFRDGSATSKFADAMLEKFNDLNFKDETLILPGKTVHKLLLCSKDDYISRFPLVLYPLENREEMIVFDVDLRA